MMLTETEIKRAMREATTERILTAGAYGKGAGVLRLRIRPGTRGTSAVWIAAWKHAGQRGSKQLGRYPDLSLVAARRKYEDEIAPLVSAGKRPRAAPVAEDKPTIERMFQGYVASMRAKGRSSAGEVERALLTGRDNAADFFGRHRVAGAIEPGDVVDYVAEFYRRDRRASADKARTYITGAYNWAIKAAHDYTVDARQDWGVKINPAASLPKDGGAVMPRERNLAAAELGKLWNAGDGFAPITLALIRTLIATGQRVQEVLRMTGADIDLQAATWTLPAMTTKGRKRAHTVPLPACILPTLAELKRQNGDGPLFAIVPGEPIQVCSVMRAITRWTKRSGVQPFQTRDLRRTWKTRTADAGVDRFTRDLIQQHAQGDTGSKHYDRADYMPQMREAMRKWNDWLDTVIRND